MLRTAAPHPGSAAGPGDPGRVTVPWFLGQHQSDCWVILRDAAERFGGDASALRTPFIRSAMDTDTYVDRFAQFDQFTGASQ